MCCPSSLTLGYLSIFILQQSLIDSFTMSKSRLRIKYLIHFKLECHRKNICSNCSISQSTFTLHYSLSLTCCCQACPETADWRLWTLGSGSGHSLSSLRLRQEPFLRDTRVNLDDKTLGVRIVIVSFNFCENLKRRRITDCNWGWERERAMYKVLEEN